MRGVRMIDNTAQSRFELVADGEVAAVEVHRFRGDDRIALVHAETFEGHEGKGLARFLLDGVLAEARRRGLAVIPECPYVRKVIAESPDAYLDLVPSHARRAFGLPS